MTTTHPNAGSYFTDGTEVVILVCFQVSTHHKHTGSLSSRQYSSSLYTSHTRLLYPPDSTVQVFVYVDYRAALAYFPPERRIRTGSSE